MKIIPNPRKPWALKLARELKAFLKVSKAGRADATVCIGGDGTILYANHQNRLKGPVIGIGSKKSYICQLTKERWKEAAKILEKNKKIRIMALEARIKGRKFTAINDFVIHAKDYRVIILDVTTGKTRAVFEGDGIIASSAIGSAAYAYSAGGKKFGPAERKISVVPICPYKRAFKPAVIGERQAVRIKVLDPAAFIADGIFIKNLKKNETVQIKKGRDIMFFEGVGK